MWNLTDLCGFLLALMTGAIAYWGVLPILKDTGLWWSSDEGILPARKEVIPAKKKGYTLITLITPEIKEKLTKTQKTVKIKIPRNQNDKFLDMLTEAVISTESNYRNIPGRHGERGIAQIKRVVWVETTRRMEVNWSYDDAWIPWKCRAVCRARLSHLLQEFKGKVDVSIKAYNKGSRGARLGRGNAYLRKVKKRMDYYQPEIDL